MAAFGFRGPAGAIAAHLGGQVVELVIDPRIKNAAPGLVLGVVQASVRVTSHAPGLWVEIDRCLEALRARVTLESIAQQEQIRAAREAYKALGKEPGRYRTSSEALVRRVLQGKGLYRVNGLVDLGNLISLETLHPVCTFDLDKILPPVALTIGELGQAYEGIGKGKFNIADLPVFMDREGPFGSPTSDSTRTRITQESTRILLMILSFTGAQGLEAMLRRARALLETHAGGHRVETAMIGGH